MNKSSELPNSSLESDDPASRVLVFITGVTSGIGRVLLRQCLEHGFDVTAVVREDRQEEELKQAMGQSRLNVLVADLGDSEAVSDLTRTVSSRRFDYVVHNAGTARMGLFADMDESSLQRILNVNLVAPMRLTRALLRKRETKKPKLIFVSSLSAHLPAPNAVTYAVSKAALSKFSQGLRAEDPAVAVLCAEIGAVDTPLHAKAGNIVADKKFFKKPEEVGRKLFHAMLNRTGVITIYPGWTLVRKFALWTDDFLTRSAMKKRR